MVWLLSITVAVLLVACVWNAYWAWRWMQLAEMAIDDYARDTTELLAIIQQYKEELSDADDATKHYRERLKQETQRHRTVTLN